jgi:hypothetical protein
MTTFAPACRIEASVSDASRSASVSMFKSFAVPADVSSAQVPESSCNSLACVNIFLADLFRGLSDLRRLALTAALEYSHLSVNLFAGSGVAHRFSAIWIRRFSRITSALKKKDQNHRGHYFQYSHFFR